MKNKLPDNLIFLEIESKFFLSKYPDEKDWIKLKSGQSDDRARLLEVGKKIQKTKNLYEILLELHPNDCDENSLNEINQIDKLFDLLEYCDICIDTMDSPNHKTGGLCVLFLILALVATLIAFPQWDTVIYNTFLGIIVLYMLYLVLHVLFLERKIISTIDKECSEQTVKQESLGDSSKT